MIGSGVIWFSVGIEATDRPVSATARLSARVAALPPLAPAATAAIATSDNNTAPIRDRFMPIPSAATGDGNRPHVPF